MKLKFNEKLLGKFLQNEAAEERTFFVLTLITGVTSALIAVGLQKGVHWIQQILQTDTTFTWQSVLLGGAALFISGWLTTRKFPFSEGSGIPKVRAALVVDHGRISLKDTFAKAVTTLLALGSGVSLGREGPTVTIASGVASWLGYSFHISKKRVKALVAVGAAGGIAAAFATPISAVVFTLEEVVGDLNAKVLGSIVISSVVASITGQMLTGQHHMFEQLYYEMHDHRELLFYLLIGISCAFIGPLWMKSVLAFREFNRKHMKSHKLTYMMIVFLIIALMTQVHSSVIGSGHGTLEDTLLSLILDPKVLFLMFCLKFLATSLCYSAGISGGLFMPTLLMGATLGSLIGSLASVFFPEITTNTGAYALVGMGAFFVTVIRAPFTSILIVFELTRDYNIILPLMIANIIAYMLSSKPTENESIYEQISAQDGIHLPTRDDLEVLDQLHVEDAMIKDIVTYGATLTVSETLKDIQKYNPDLQGFPVLKNGRLIGMMSTSELRVQLAKGNGDIRIEQFCEKKIIKIYPDQSLYIALHRLKRFQISRLPVVSRLDEKRIIGILTPKDIVKQFGYQITESKENEANS
ncbi:chloride channel protein [Halobacteriovorax sp. ZH4_bin.1]|uniref:chloride channel protein n=1 Tax=unclassified Halobacteriovorax TaxID=2639665 RepID=UPI0037106D01